MPLPDDVRRQLHELLSALSDGRLGAAQFDQLQKLLSEPDAQQYYVDFAMLDACLDLAGAEETLSDETLQQVASDELDRASPLGNQSSILGFLDAAMRVAGANRLRLIVGTALLLLVGVVLSVVALKSLRGRHDDPHTVAVVKSSDNPKASTVPNMPFDEMDLPRSFPRDMEIAPVPMLDPVTDRSDKPWCYLAKSTTVIGLPEQPHVTQVTYDGAIYTQNAELCFFYGDKDRPLLARQKNWLEGWIPVVQYSWREGDIEYDVEMFAARLEGENVDNTVNFAQLRMRNAGKQPATGRFAAAMRHNAGEYRAGRSEFSPNWRYEMTGNAALRDGKLTYVFAPGADCEAVPAVPYTHAFVGSQLCLTPRAECCLARYHKKLAPGETFAATFKMPRVPASESAYNKKVVAADYNSYRASTVAYWRKLFDGAAAFNFPEQRVQEAERASLVHVLLATRKRDQPGPDKIGWTQTDGLAYDDFFMTSTPQMVLAYLQSGQFDRAKSVVLRANEYQKSNGLYLDVALAHGVEIPAGHGHGMYSAAMTVIYSQDKQFGERVYPNLQKAVQYIVNSIEKDEYGLLPPTYPYDSEMINGHYTSNNLWALLGLRSAIRVARFLGKTDNVKAWSELEQRYSANILKGVRASAKDDGYVPPGLYKYLTGQAARKGFDEWQTNQDWENMSLAFPGELLKPTDPHVRGTVDHVRKNYAEGVMPYRIYMHEYITANQVEQYMAMGDGYTALKDFYHLMLHTGPTSEGFENLVQPWADRQVNPGCPPPHAWASSKLACLIRDLVLLEYGGNAGLEPGKRELWLFHCLSPAWVKPGERISIANASTEFGSVNATMQFDDRGATISVGGKYHKAPAAYRLHVPYFKELTSFKTDAKESRREGDWIVLSPDATTARLDWQDKPGAHLHTIEHLLTDYRSANRNLGPDALGFANIEPGKAFLLDGEKSDAPQPLSFDTVREAYQHEYARLAKESEKSFHVEAPAMLTTSQRRESFHRLFILVRRVSPQKNMTADRKSEASHN